MSEVEFDAEPEESDAVVKAGRPRRPSTPPNIRAIVWARAAGRCQFRGCNKLLIGDLVSGKSDLNASYIAHIVADSVDGPRGHKSLSSELSTRPGNLMLMCDPHHRLIDGPATRHEYPNKIELDFAIQLQEQSKWCWAATASSISHHYEPNASRSQNEIVGRALKIPPPWIPDESWNQPAPMMTGLRIVRCDAGTQCDTASFRRILKELDKNNPICVQIEWPTKEGHAVVITGGWIAEDGSEHYIVGDPEFGDSFPVPGDELQLDYLEYKGKWVQTYFVRAPY